MAEFCWQCAALTGIELQLVIIIFELGVIAGILFVMAMRR